MSNGSREIIAKNIQQFRRQKKMTQKELAKQLGVNNSAVSNWETGVNSIDIDTLFKVCKILGVTANDMYGWDNGELTSNKPTTLAAHFDGEDYTAEELEEINNFVEFVKQRRKK